jgi:fructuronate reductase
MKLNRESIKTPDVWPDGYRLPAFDVETVTARTAEEPVWLHFGAGNIFKIFPALAQQDLIERGLADSGILVCECYDGEIIPASFTPYDNLSLGVTLFADGHTEKRVIASITDTVAPERLDAVFAKPSLQLVTFTRTEKGYNAANDTIKKAAEGLRARFNAGGVPLALVSMDNCSRNGEKLHAAVVGALTEAKASSQLLDYVNSRVSFPWSMIDKITPRPSEKVAALLSADGFEDTLITETAKHTFVAPFVNAESCQYLVLEDDFPNGRPPFFEETGIFMTGRETVEKAEQMKVGCCLNPLHTILGTAGMLLGKPTIASCMEDARLVNFIRAASEEAMPVVTDPGVLNPRRFLEEVLTERFPNPFIPDTPARIVADNSQKIYMRFGVPMKARTERGLGIDGLKAFPVFCALWCRYLQGTDDNMQPMKLSQDPRLAELTAHAEAKRLRPILSDASIFGVDLYEAGLGETIEALFNSLQANGAVDKILSDKF